VGLVFIFGGALILLLFAAMHMAKATENKTLAQHELAKAELERAKSERELTHLEVERSEIQSANERALILSKARDNALAQILSADLQSKNELLLKIGQRGGLIVQFSDGNNDEDQGTPRISWEWSPFQNAVVKIYRNEGSILESIKSVMAKANLIHVEQHDAEGFYDDREAIANHTYNYYAFIETRRTGVKAQAVTLDLPAEVRTGKVIDQNGDEITAFNTVQPVTYEEPFFDGFCYRRLTVVKWLGERERRKESLDKRREDLEFKEEEAELAKLEKQTRLRSGNFNTEHIEALIAEAKKIAGRGSVTEKAEKLLDDDDSLDDRQREIILAFIRKNSYR